MAERSKKAAMPAVPGGHIEHLRATFEEWLKTHQPLRWRLQLLHQV
jgi:hypothetical protein